jgi:hypothetical protein
MTLDDGPSVEACTLELNVDAGSEDAAAMEHACAPAGEDLEPFMQHGPPLQPEPVAVEAQASAGSVSKVSGLATW